MSDLGANIKINIINAKSTALQSEPGAISWNSPFFT